MSPTASKTPATMVTAHRGRPHTGFTLVELAVVVVIIGVLAAFAVPRFRSAVERTKAAESFNYLSTVQSAMERYHVRQGIYADDIVDLDVEMGEPEYFSVSAVAVPGSEADLQTGWEVTLTRSGNSAGYGAYTVVFNQDGFDGISSSIDAEISPLQTGS